jgi:hypothetical protein
MALQFQEQEGPGRSAVTQFGVYKVWFVNHPPNEDVKIGRMGHTVFYATRNGERLYEGFDAADAFKSADADYVRRNQEQSVQDLQTLMERVITK